jgi:hypothetical protein
VRKKGGQPDEQINRFREVARELESDESEAASKAKLAVIGRHVPKKDDPAKPMTHKGRKAR